MDTAAQSWRTEPCRQPMQSPTEPTEPTTTRGGKEEREVTHTLRRSVNLGHPYEQTHRTQILPSSLPGVPSFWAFEEMRGSSEEEE